MAEMIDCPGDGRRDQALGYLAGRLPEEDARAFEAHYFECEACWQEVRVSSELRDAFGKPAVAPAAPASRPSRGWLPLAAAAAIAFAAVGVWQFGRRGAVEAAPSVLRGGTAAALDVRIETTQGKLSFAWLPHPDAATYVVRVLSSDAAEVWKSEVREPRLELDPAILPASPAGASLLVQVEALDPMRQVVATSDPVPLPRP